MFGPVSPEWLLRIFCATAMGTCIGFERHHSSKDAGIRTHSIVAMSAALLMIISKYGFADIGTGDPARVAAQVVSGIGFLGAGIIYVRHDVIQGLTTAAGVWATSAIGMTFGAGLYLLGFFCSALMLVIQLVIKGVFELSGSKTAMRLRVYLKKNATAKVVSDRLRPLGYTTSENRLYAGAEGWILETEASTLRDADPSKLLEVLNAEDLIEKAEILPK